MKRSEVIGDITKTGQEASLSELALQRALLKEPHVRKSLWVYTTVSLSPFPQPTRADGYAPLIARECDARSPHVAEESPLSPYEPRI